MRVERTIAITRISKFEQENNDILVANVFPTGVFYHPIYGEVNVTEELLEEIVQNFKLGYPKYGVSLNIHHDPKLGKYGEVIDLIKDERGLWAKIKLNEKGIEKYYDEGYKYFSIELVEDYVDPETNQVVGAVLDGIALTYLPAHPLVPEYVEAKAPTVFEMLKNFFAFGEKQLFYVPPVQNSPSSDVEEWNWDWARDADTIIENLGWEGLARACAYVEKENGKLPERKSAYSLPHHKFIDGKLKLVKGGVRAAMQRLKSAKIPDSEKKAVYNHLAAHYRYFGMTPPEFEDIVSKTTLEDGEVDKVKEFERQEYERLKIELEQLKQELEQLKLEKEQIDAKRIELEKEVETLKNSLRESENALLNERFETLKKEGYAPAVVDKFKVKVLEGKMSFEEAVELIKETINFSKQEMPSKEREIKTAYEKGKELAEKVYKK